MNFPIPPLLMLKPKIDRLGIEPEGKRRSKIETLRADTGVKTDQLTC